MAKVLTLTVGLPRSGKTTWVLRHTNSPIVSPDAVRLALHGQRFAAPAEEFVWACCRVMVRALFLAGHNHVIVDATNVTEKRRREWESPEWKVELEHLFTPAAECIRRARAESDADIIPVIERMAEDAYADGWLPRP